MWRGKGIIRLTGAQCQHNTHTQKKKNGRVCVVWKGDNKSYRGTVSTENGWGCVAWKGDNKSYRGTVSTENNVSVAVSIKD